MAADLPASILGVLADAALSEANAQQRIIGWSEGKGLDTTKPWRLVIDAAHLEPITDN